LTGSEEDVNILGKSQIYTERSKSEDNESSTALLKDGNTKYIALRFSEATKVLPSEWQGQPPDHSLLQPKVAPQLRMNHTCDRKQIETQ